MQLRKTYLVFDRNPVNYFAEVEQAAFGTGVLVDGLEFWDDNMLLGRSGIAEGRTTLQVPINRPRVPVATNQREGR